jgi:hypothetical protein
MDLCKLVLFSKMITEISLQNMPDANQQLWAIFQAFDDLLFILDSDGTILDFKAGSMTNLYTSPDKFMLRRIQDVMPADVGAKIECYRHRGSRIHSLNTRLSPRLANAG